jgi:hypothetical protein
MERDAPPRMHLQPREYVSRHGVARFGTVRSVDASPTRAHLLTELLFRCLDRHCSRVRRVILEETFDPLGELPQERRLRSARPTRSTLDEEIARQIDGRHHGELTAVDGSRAIAKTRHGLVDEICHALQVARVGIGSNSILQPQDSDRHRPLARHG